MQVDLFGRRWISKAPQKKGLKAKSKASIPSPVDRMKLGIKRHPADEQ
jgi:hypothetical protein